MIRLLLLGSAMPLAAAGFISRDDTPSSITIIPRPAEVRLETGSLAVEVLPVVAAPPAAQHVADYLIKGLLAAGVRAVQDAAVPAAKGQLGAELGGGTGVPITLKLDPARNQGEEAYALVVRSEGVELIAAEPAGLMRGAATILQLLQPGSRDGDYQFPLVSIEDRPRYRWRGMLLDCGRHFWPKEFVKRYIDLLAYHKMNVLHWHLTEDQGWRIEIQKRPRLTEVGAWRKATRDSEQPRDAQGRYGGFYSRDDIREIVAYAASRHILVVPEIEMPGHSRAALAAYPELSCTGGPFEVATDWGVFEDVFCAGDDQTFEFLENVLSEVTELFPSPYIHIGGDECPKSRWKDCPKCQARIRAEGLKDEHELQSYFIKRIEKYLAGKGRRLIGWDEILEGGLPPNASVQSWRGMDGAIAAATSGHDVISSPTSHCYLDYAQARNPGEPTFMGFIALEKTYSFEPTPGELSAEQALHVLGAEGNMWAEHTPTQALVDRQLWPRLAALAEVTWSPKDARNYEDFLARLRVHYRRLDQMGVQYYVPLPAFKSGPIEFADQTTLELGLEPQAPPDCEIRYTLDGTEPTAQSTLAPWPASPAAPPLTFTQTSLVKACTFLRNGRPGAVATVRFRKLLPNPPIVAAVCERGMRCEYYEGRWEKLPDLTGVKPAFETVAGTPDLSPRKRDTEFALRFSAFFEAPEDGVYTFYLKADDRARLTVGGEDPAVIEVNWSDAARAARAWLRKGPHPFELLYVQLGGAMTLEVEYEAPGIERQPLPMTAFTHDRRP